MSETDFSAETNKSAMSAFVIGYTGEVGKQLVRALVKAHQSNAAVFSSVTLIGRRQVELDAGSDVNTKQVVINFDEMDKHSEAFAGKDVAFCCLGTTRAKSGVEGFRKVDHDYIVNAAKQAKLGGVKEYHLISSIGANANSNALYMQVKGQVEEELKELNFDHLYIYRPGFLLSEREEFRAMEWFMSKFAIKIVNFICPDSYSIKTTVLADTMVKIASTFQAKDRSITLENKFISTFFAKKEAK